MNNRKTNTNKCKPNYYLYKYNIIALEFYRTKQINNINIKSKKSIVDINNFPKDFPINMKNNISTANNLHKTKYEDIKNSSNKEEKLNINNYRINNMNNNINIIDDKNKYLNIKKNLLSTAINSLNNKNNINNLYNSPKLNHRQNKSNHFNKTYKNNNFGFNKNNIYFKYYNDHQNDMNNNLLLSERSKGDNNNNNNDKEEYNKNIMNLDLYNEQINDNSYEYNGSNKSDDDDEPDPRINFEQINQINKSRPLTSYGGLNARRQNLQSALQKNKMNRPITSYNTNN